MTVFKRKTFCPDAPGGKKYRIVYSKNKDVIILIDIYCKNKVLKTPIDNINRCMANIEPDCCHLPVGFSEIFDLNTYRSLFENGVKR